MILKPSLTLVNKYNSSIGINKLCLHDSGISIHMRTKHFSSIFSLLFRTLQHNPHMHPLVLNPISTRHHLFYLPTCSHPISRHRSSYNSQLKPLHICVFFHPSNPLVNIKGCHHRQKKEYQFQ